MCVYVCVRACVCGYALEVDSMKLTDLWQAHWSCGLSTQRSRVQIQSRILFRDFCSNQFSYKEYTDRTPSVGRRGGDGGDWPLSPYAMAVKMKSLTPVADPGGQIRLWPLHRSWQWNLAPSGAERVMTALWICRKVRILLPPYRCRLRIWPPYGKLGKVAP